MTFVTSPDVISDWAKKHQLTDYTRRVSPHRFVSSLAYYGLGLSVGTLSGSVHVNFLLSGVMELAAYVLCICLLDRVGRRPLNSALMLLAGLACISTLFTTLYAPRCKCSLRDTLEQSFDGVPGTQKSRSPPVSLHRYPRISF